MSTCAADTLDSSTETQSLLRQRHILTEAGLLVRTGGVAERFHPADGALLCEDPATTSEIPHWSRLVYADFLALLDPKERQVVILLNSGITKLTEIASLLGYKNHSPISKRLAQIRKKAAAHFADR